ncbi:MAG: demethoxyubiquinone hydroxylase family protein [Rhodospirillaceae bacterium]
MTFQPRLTQRRSQAKSSSSSAAAESAKRKAEVTPFAPTQEQMEEHRSGRVTGANRKPGDLDKAAMIDRFLRVDHAGEFGAVRIYEGQIAVLKRRSANLGVLNHMLEQEEVHLETFKTLGAQRRARPTLMHPIWHVAGFALGAGTALMGEKAAMACTAAVEEVIDEHYQKQYDALGDDELPLKATIETFRQEEVEHRDIGYRNGAEEAPAYPLLSRVIKTGCKAAIWVSERV